MNAFRHTSYVVTEIQDLKDFHNFSIWKSSHIMDIPRSENTILAFGWCLAWSCRFNKFAVSRASQNISSSSKSMLFDHAYGPNFFFQVRYIWCFINFTIYSHYI